MGDFFHAHLDDAHLDDAHLDDAQLPITNYQLPITEHDRICDRHHVRDIAKNRQNGLHL
jgi:hypothetical protein